jgi:hypothetical protein
MDGKLGAMKHDSVMCGEYAEPAFAAYPARLFASLADPSGVRVLLAMGDDEVSTNHLADILEMAPEDVQRYLHAYEELEVVRGTTYGAVRLFRVCDAHVRNLLFERLRASDPPMR